MNGHARIAQHRLGARRGDDDIVARLGARWFAFFVKDRMLIRHAISQRIAQMPVLAFDLTRLDFKIRDCRLEMRVPVDQPLVAIDQPVIIEIDEDLAHSFNHLIVGVAMLAHGEGQPRPVTACTKALELLDDLPPALFFPLPDFLDEFLAGKIGALFAVRVQLPLNDHLRRNASMICAWLPEDVLALHPRKTDQHVLQRIVQRMAHMQDAGDIGRRDDD